jgi:hypothetical protein
MANEQELVEKDAPEDDIQVEVIPEEDKPRLKGGDTRSLDVGDDEIQGYGREVQNRIKKLRFAFHEERRLREMKERDLASTTDFAQRLHRENEQLKRNVARTEQAVVHQAISRVDAEIDSARKANRAALEAGNAEHIVDAGEKLARAVAEKERLNLLKSDEGERTDTVQQQPPPQQQPPQQDERTRAWFGRNPWWNKPGEEVRTALAMGVHNHLAARGITANSHPDLYWKTIDEKLAEHFPVRTNGNGNGHAEDREEQDRDNTASRPLAVAGGTRANTGGANAGRTRVIRLSESQVRLARTLGLTPEQYAHQIAIEEGANHG